MGCSGLTLPLRHVLPLSPDLLLGRLTNHRQQPHGRDLCPTHCHDRKVIHDRGLSVEDSRAAGCTAPSSAHLFRNSGEVPEAGGGEHGASGFDQLGAKEAAELPPEGVVLGGPAGKVKVICGKLIIVIGGHCRISPEGRGH
ncbi:unnamed protein product [Cuscuta campestris]|uniref:Uncharacterized protein n=1 Tax=Cuscuta campestris TaxID=132261 RepID=A0A484MSE2_9ASTE|nr:unnamed protein product [Cuscuta campestris]